MGRAIPPTMCFSVTFFKKDFKKIKFEKGVPIGKILENGYLPPVPKLFPGPSRGPLRE
jgi:hypothetical protein